ncbi:MAG: hypothetical protein KR126chlam3_00501 [Chlamydiae bacterium]|nr:hypothetical protein [Chlamydiota bacterium]
MASLSNVEEYQRSVAELYAHFSEGMQQLLHSRSLSEQDRESLQRVSGVVEGVALRYMETGHQSAVLEQRVCEGFRDQLCHTVEHLLPLKEREAHVVHEELGNLREAAEFLQITYGNPESSSLIVPFNRRARQLKSLHPQFVERRGVFAEITTKFSEQAILVLHGPPGVGKSEVAIAFGNQRLKEFPVVWTIHAETKDQIESSYRELSQALGLPLLKEDTFEAMERRLFAKLENLDVPWLLIYDNLESPIHFPQRGGKILITTNFSENFSLYVKGWIEIPCFEKEEAIALLKEVTEEEESEEMNELVEKLGRYPLVISQIAGAIRMTPGETIQSASTAMAKVDFSKMRPSERYRATLQEMLDRLLPKLSREALEWLFVCAYLSPEKISCSYIEIWLQTHAQLSEENSKQKAQEILSVLVNRGWLRFDGLTQTFSIHRLFQVILKEKDRDSYYEQVLDLLLKYWEKINLDNKNLKFPTLSDEFCSHAVPLVDDSKFMNISPSKLAVFCKKIGDAKTVRSRFQEALEKYEQVLKIWESFSSPNHSDIEELLFIMSDCLVRQDRYSEALKKLEKVLSIRESSLNIDHPDIAKVIESMGTILRFQGKYQEAIEKYQFALEIYKKSLPSDHPDVERCQCGIEMSQECQKM